MAREYSARKVIPGTVYRVVRQLGAGGMGCVYEVEDVTVGKAYALKTLHGEIWQDRDSLARLALESRVLARVQHPNIVNVVTAGVTHDGAVYYVMDLLRGASLRGVIDHMGVLEPRHAVRIALSVATALERAHAEAVVHRDIKPDNIFVSMQPDRSTVVKVVDFGIAALLQNLPRIEKEQGMLIGTPGYSSPQQLRGERADAAMDVWSLGVVLFEMLTGRPLFPVAIAPALSAILSDLPAPDLGTEAPGTPTRLARLVASMLEKDRHRRIGSAAMVGSELREILGEVRRTPRERVSTVGGTRARDSRAAPGDTAGDQQTVSSRPPAARDQGR